jgi:hypothetical protein
VSQEAPTTIAEAIEDITEDDLVAEETDEEVDDESTDDDNDAEGDDESSDGDDESSDDSDESEDDDDSGDDDDETDDEDGEDADWGVDDEEEEDSDTDFFDDLTQEQLAEIKKNPELNALRKQLMKGYEKKTTQHSNLVKLGEAYRKDPLAVLKGIASQLGVQVVKPEDPKGADDKGEKKPTKSDLAAQKLEKLFGDKAGPAVREALSEFVAAVNEENLQPVNEKLSKADADAEAARFLKEEADFRERHSKTLTPEIEAEVVKLGESGRFSPGPKQTAADYLDTLLEIAQAKMGKTVAKKAGREASKKLRKKIENNRRDREPRGRSSKSGVKKVSRLQKEPESFRSISEAVDAAAAEMEEDFEE